MTRLLLHRPELIIPTNCCVIGISGLIVQLHWGQSFRANQRRAFPAANDWHGNSLMRLRTSARQPLYQWLGYSAWHSVSSTADSLLTGRQVSWLAGGFFFFFPWSNQQESNHLEKPNCKWLGSRHVVPMHGNRKDKSKEEEDASEPEMIHCQVCWLFTCLW